MAGAAASSNAAADAWVWHGLWDKFGEDTNKVENEKERQAVEKELRERWSNIPARYKQVVGPLFSDRLQAMRHAKRVRTIADKLADPISLEEYNSAKAGEDLRHAAQYRPSYEEHLQAWKDVRDATGRVIRATINLRDALAPWEAQGFISRDILVSLRASIVKLREDHKFYIDYYAGRLEAREENLAAERKAKELHLRNGEPLDAGWVGQWVLGKGAFGQASLFVRQDRRGVIVDRLVVKDSTIDPPDSRPEQWFEDARGLYPLEVHALYRLQGRKGSENLMRMRGWRMKADRIIKESTGRKPYLSPTFRMWLEFYPNGDLDDLRLEDYVYKQDGKRFLHYLPEPFLWKVFLSLANAGLVLQYGTNDSRDRLNEPWRQIIHADIKMENIMLGQTPQQHARELALRHGDVRMEGTDSEGEDPSHSYPEVVLADFGLCVYMNGDSENAWPRGGTPRCEGPEMTGNLLDPKTGKTRPLHRNSDVWAVGNVIYCLMEGVRGLHHLNYRRNWDPKNLPTQTKLIKSSETYSEALWRAVGSCMEFMPEDRPSFRQLKDYIERNVKTREPAHPDELNPVRTSASKWPLWENLANAKPLPDGFPNPPQQNQLSRENPPGDRPAFREVTMKAHPDIRIEAIPSKKTQKSRPIEAMEKVEPAQRVSSQAMVGAGSSSSLSSAPTTSAERMKLPSSRRASGRYDMMGRPVKDPDPKSAVPGADETATRPKKAPKRPKKAPKRAAADGDQVDDNGRGKRRRRDPGFYAERSRSL